jgi:hypothetical protein
MNKRMPALLPQAKTAIAAEANSPIVQVVYNARE